MSDFGPVKREAGVSPARTRRCKEVAVFYALSSHWFMPGRPKYSVDIQVRRPAYDDIVEPRVIG